MTASISNSAVKTTHLTGLTTDLGILFAMFTKSKYRKNKELKGKFRLLISIVSAYMVGGVFSGILYLNFQFSVFFIVCIVICIILVYDYSKLRVVEFIRTKKRGIIIKTEDS